MEKIVVRLADEIDVHAQSQIVNWFVQHASQEVSVKANSVMGLLDPEGICAIASVIISGASLVLQFTSARRSAENMIWTPDEILTHAQRALIKYGIHDTELRALVGAEPFFAGGSDLLKVVVAERRTERCHEVWLKRTGNEFLVMLDRTQTQ